ncbi:DUF5131 family protein [Novosphingobium guangzhouense]|uniref:Phage Gp37/Gp68 family protein n=1 Tax=Novosphingobium guangzhouense TaxID=1850347 RepID=A0A2K2FUN6_9SPHN|nr:phage Gp37/Gp68 family protein [Novosphingobium guangzhouense]PNU02493.1 hypothetical protein A8V01_08915 [Novosphingobium guangzhouense]
MADRTAIEWTDATWTPVKGCTRASEGCRNCYAEIMAARFSDPGQWGEGLATIVSTPQGKDHRWTGVVRFVDAELLKPLSWRKPRLIFVCSTSDLFHESVPDEWIDQVFAVMALCPQHTFQVLTKRADRMRGYLSAKGLVRRICVAAHAIWQARPTSDDGPEFSRANSRRFNAKMKEWWRHVGALTAWTVDGGCAHVCWRRDEPDAEYPSRIAWPLPNVWLGVSVEDQQRAEERIPDLLATPAAVRWLSCEPLLGPVDLTDITLRTRPGEAADGLAGVDALTGLHWDAEETITGIYGDPDPHIDWVVVGGESGHGARPMHPQWAWNLRDQCAEAGVPFFFKQWGEWAPVCAMPDTDEMDEFLYQQPKYFEGPRRCKVEQCILWGTGRRFDLDCWSRAHGEDPANGIFASGHRNSMQMMKIGKKRAGRLLDRDGTEHNGMPS